MIGEIWETWKSIARPSLLLGVAAILIGFLAGLLFPGLSGYSQPLYIAGLILLGVGLVGSLESIRDLFVAPGARNSGVATLIILVFAGVLIFANALVFRSGLSLDLTANAAFTLSEQSRQIARQLGEPLEVTGFFSDDRAATREIAEALIRRYQAENPGQISYRFYNPSAEPGLVQQLGITQDASMVFQVADRRTTVTDHTEQGYTSGILRALAVEQKQVYFIVGHGEREYNDFRDGGMGNLTNALRNDNYAVSDLNLVTAGEVPANAAAIVIADPQTPFQAQELNALARYFNSGGRALIFYDGRAEVNLKPLLATYGINYSPLIPPAIVVDPQSIGGDGLTPAVQRYPVFNDITRNLQTTFFPRPGVIELPLPRNSFDGLPDTQQPIQPSAELGYPLRASLLAATSENSWLELNPDARPIVRNPTDPAGPFVMAVQMERFVPLGQARDPNEPQSLRMVVFANTDFAINQFVDVFFNKDLAVNSVNWLTGDQQLIAIRPRAPDNRFLFVSQAQVPFVLFSSIVLIPGLVLVAGGVVWYRRR